MGEGCTAQGHQQRVRRCGAALRAYARRRPADGATVARMQVLLGSGVQAFSRDHFLPGHFTASAFVLSPDGGRLLLILHAKLGLWLQPGGHVEAGDSDLLAAARRELREEANVVDARLEGEGIFDVDIHTIPAGRSPRHLHFDVRFLFRARDERVVAASDALAVRWVALAEVAAQNSDASVMRAVRRLLPRPR